VLYASVLIITQASTQIGASSSNGLTPGTAAGTSASSMCTADIAV
jgi:hypothetical protein